MALDIELRSVTGLNVVLSVASGVQFFVWHQGVEKPATLTIWHGGVEKAVTSVGVTPNAV